MQCSVTITNHSQSEHCVHEFTVSTQSHSELYCVNHILWNNMHFFFNGMSSFRGIVKILFISTLPQSVSLWPCLYTWGATVIETNQLTKCMDTAKEHASMCLFQLKKVERNLKELQFKNGKCYTFKIVKKLSCKHLVLKKINNVLLLTNTFQF